MSYYVEEQRHQRRLRRQKKPARAVWFIMAACLFAPVLAEALDRGGARCRLQLKVVGIMSKQGRDEKYEKQEEKDEKELSKQEEKSFEEKWRRDSLGSIVWALILIWAGIVFLASNTGMLDAFNAFFERIGLQTADLPFVLPFMRLEAWSLIFVGAGVLLLAEVVIRLLIPSYRRPVVGTAILAVVALGIGLGTWGLIWPLVLIIAGLAILLGGLFRSK